ncbi:MAG: hypothetical protein R2705_22290 [Ilumatobacteraceae bacterium]
MVLAVLAPRRELACAPEGWILATAATLLVGCSTMLLIAVALRLAQGLEIRETLRTSAPSSILMTVLSSGLGLALAAVANGDAANLWLLAPALLVVGFGVRVHHRLQRRTDQLETIHTGLAELSAALVADDVAEILMRRSVAAIGAEQAVLVLRVDDRHGSSASMERAGSSAATTTPRWPTLVAACSAGGGWGSIGHETGLLGDCWRGGSPGTPQPISPPAGPRTASSRSSTPDDRAGR